MPCTPQEQYQLWAKTNIYMCLYPGAREDYHDDFDKSSDESHGVCSDLRGTTQYEGWTSLASGKGNGNNFKERSKLAALSPQLPTLPMQPPFIGHRRPNTMTIGPSI
jgi:hypothetical protein